MPSDPAPARSEPGAVQRLLELLGLCTLAVGQPVFSLVGHSPEFFAARKTPTPAVVLFALVVVLGLPLAAMGVEWLAGRARPGWQFVAHDLLRLVLLATLALGILNTLDLQLVRSIDIDLPGWLLFPLATACGAAALALLHRSDVCRTFVRFLAAAAPLALVVFLASAPTASTAAAPRAGATRPAPIVMIVLDELPTTSLLSAPGRIDARRLPNFARLARDGTWYPDTTTVADQTTSAVPALLSGRRGPTDIRSPDLDTWPVNLFTLLRGRYAMHVREPITRLCPPDECRSEARSTGQAVRSLASESPHLALLSLAPSDLAPRSPLIGGANVRDPGREFGGLISGLSKDRRPTLDFLHVLSPHRPWGRLPSGRPYAVTGDDGIPSSVRETLRLPADHSVALKLWRAHLLQLGYTDRLLGRVIARLKALGTYDRSLIVVAADHGVSFRPGAPLRDVTPANVNNIAPVPLFVKRPHGRGRGVDPAPARTIDVLPTILDAIGARIPAGVQGVSLLRHPKGPRPVRVLTTHGAGVGTTLQRLLRARAGLVRTQRDQVIGSDEWRRRCALPGSGC